VLDQIMVANLRDEAQSWTLDAEGKLHRVPVDDLDKAFSAHTYFMTNPSLSGRGSASISGVRNSLLTLLRHGVRWFINQTFVL